MEMEPENPLVITLNKILLTFQFKQFSIRQDKTAMKVGTDGVLLGAWTPLEPHCNRILDIGAGTGLIALMLAQRSTAETIDAIEIEPMAHEQCIENFEASPWGDRLFCYHADLVELIEEPEELYDLIVSNPPFHNTDITGEKTSRTTARQTEDLPFETLLYGAKTLLSPQGTFCCILPFIEETSFINLAKQFGLYPFKITRVKGNPKAPYKRSLLAFQFRRNPLIEEELIIEQERHQYTEAYVALSKEFYLKM